MVKIKKQVNLTGESWIDDTQVVYMTATLSSEKNSNTIVSKTIVNQEVYNANRVAVRQDMNDFDDEVFKIEDEMYQASIPDVEPGV